MDKKKIETQIDKNAMDRLLLSLQSVIRAEVVKVISSMNLELYIDLCVVSYDDDNGLCKCKDLGSGEIYEDILNYTNEALAPGNIVRVYYKNQDRFVGRRLTGKE